MPSSLYKNLEKLSKGLPLIDRGDFMRLIADQTISIAEKESVIDGEEGLPQELKDELKNNLSDRRQVVKLIKDNCAYFSGEEVEEILAKKLYLALPTGENSPRQRLKNFIAERSGEEEASNISLSARDVAIADIPYVYVTLQYGSRKDYDEIENYFPEIRAIFGEDINEFEEFIRVRKSAYPNTVDIISKSLDDVEWTQASVAITDIRWKRLFADPQAIGIIDNLIYRHREIEENFGENFPTTVNELLERGLEIDCPEVMDRISSLDNLEQQAKIFSFAKDYYKYYLKTKNVPAAAKNGKKFSDILNESVNIILDADRKKPIEGRNNLPEIQEVPLEHLVEFRRERYKELIDKIIPQDLREEALEVFDGLPPNYFSTEKYKIRLLPDDDYRGFYLGKLTNCCQSMDGIAAEAVKYGMTQPDSGFYIIEDKDGRVVGHSWAWIAEDNKTIVLDSFEKLGQEGEEAFAALYGQLYITLKDAGFHNVYLGIGPNRGILFRDYKDVGLLSEGIKFPVREDFSRNPFLHGLLSSDSVDLYDLSSPLMMPQILFFIGYLATTGRKETAENLFSQSKIFLTSGYQSIELALKVERPDIAENIYYLYGVHPCVLFSSPMITKWIREKMVNNLKPQTLYQAITWGVEEQIVKWLIEHSAPENFAYQDHLGGTSLSYVIRQGKEELALLMIKKMRVKDLSLQGIRKESALHFAVLKGNQKIVDALIAAGVNLNIQNARGGTALHYAAGGATIEGCPKFLENLYYFAQVEAEIVRSLTEAGADVNIQDKNGRTALHYSARVGSLDIVNMLLSNSADPTLQDSFDKTALHYTPERKCTKEGKANAPLIEEAILDSLTQELEQSFLSLPAINPRDEELAIDSNVVLSNIITSKISSTERMGATNSITSSLGFASNLLSNVRKFGFKGFFFNKEIAAVQQLMEEHSIDHPLNDIHQDLPKIYKKLSLKLHPDKHSASEEEFVRLNTYKELLLNEEELAGRANEFISKALVITHNAAIGINIANTGVDIVRAYNNPTYENIYQAVRDGSHVGSLVCGFNQHISNIKLLEISYQVYEGEYSEALSNSITFISFASLPFIMKNINPMLSLAYSIGITAYSAYNLFSNAYKLHEELTTHSQMNENEDSQDSASPDNSIFTTFKQEDVSLSGDNVEVKMV